jgi:hypothetical protein
MSNQSIQLTRMYYVPTVYYWVDNIHEGVKLELNEKYNQTKKIFYDTIDRFKKSTEKTSEYIEYKSLLIRLILLDYAHFTPNGKGIDLLENIINKWKDNTMIKPKTKDMIYIRSITNILKYEKIINNIEEIMMLINLQILENYYK